MENLLASQLKVCAGHHCKGSGSSLGSLEHHCSYMVVIAVVAVVVSTDRMAVAWRNSRKAVVGRKSRFDMAAVLAEVLIGRRKDPESVGHMSPLLWCDETKVSRVVLFGPS